MITEKTMAIRDRESMGLETVSFERRILLIECYRRYDNHMTKSCILQILNLKQNVECNLVEAAEKSFQAPKFILKSPKLID